MVQHRCSVIASHYYSLTNQIGKAPLKQANSIWVARTVLGAVECGVGHLVEGGSLDQRRHGAVHSARNFPPAVQVTVLSVCAGHVISTLLRLPFAVFPRFDALFSGWRSGGLAAFRRFLFAKVDSGKYPTAADKK